MARRTADAEALEALLEGHTAHDDAPRSLARLAGLATAVREQTSLEAPTDEFRDRLRAELFVVAAAGRPTLWDRARDRVEVATAGLRHSVRTAGAAALASTMIGATGVAAAAQSALPGDVLYSVKGFTEDARLAFASGDVERGRLHLAFARERLEEVEDGRARLTPDALTTTFDRLDTEAADGAEELLAAAATEGGSPALLDELDDFTAEVRGRLLVLSPDLPLSVRPAAERTLEVLRRIDVQVAGLLDLVACEECGTAVTGALPRVVLPGEGPAAPACRCVTPAPSGEDDGDEPALVPDPTAQPAPRPSGSGVGDGTPAEGAPPLQAENGGPGVVGGVGEAVGDVVDAATEPLDDVGSIVDDIVGTSPADGGVAGEVASEVASTAEEAASEVVSTAEEAASDAVGTAGGVADDATSTAEDVADEATSAVEDVVGGPVDGLLD